MGIEYSTEVSVDYSNDFISIPFNASIAISVEDPETLVATRDELSETLAISRSANTTEPTVITLTVRSQCVLTDENTTIINKLHDEFQRSIQVGNTPSKGLLVITRKSDGRQYQYGECFLSQDPLFKARTIDVGGTAAEYTVIFMAAREIFEENAF